MAFSNILNTTGISASGLAAERLRMEVIANNIANANSTRGKDGGPFRRQQVVFATELDNIQGGDSKAMGGVRVAGINPDQSPLNKVYRPGHPDADGEGFVLMPNVNLSTEMVDLVSATRGYEANLKILKSFRESVQQSLALLNAR